jgi:hypothetical protein
MLMLSAEVGSCNLFVGPMRCPNFPMILLATVFLHNIECTVGLSAQCGRPGWIMLFEVYPGGVGLKFDPCFS